MTPLDLTISAGSIAIATAGVAYVVHIVRHAGRDRPNDPTRVQHLVETAPMERLDNVLAK